MLNEHFCMNFHQYFTLQHCSPEDKATWSIVQEIFVCCGIVKPFADLLEGLLTQALMQLLPGGRYRAPKLR